MALPPLRSCLKKNGPLINSGTAMSGYKQHFHQVHGRNVELLADGTIARRVASYAHGISFSGRPIKPGEVFLIEITEVERGWSGDLRVGFTINNPSNMISSLPEYSLPSLVEGYKSWIKPAFKELNSQLHTDTGRDYAPLSRYSQLVVDELEAREVRAVAERMERATLAGLEALGPIVVERMQPNYKVYEDSPGSIRCECRSCVGDSSRCGRAPGSRIGVVYFVSEGIITMRLIINGDDQGPIAPPMPVPEAPLYAVVDVYGGTKEVSVIEASDFVPRLMDACKSCILANFTAEEITASGLPKRQKEFLVGYQGRL